MCSGTRLLPSFFAAFFGSIQIGASFVALNFVENFGKCWLQTVGTGLIYEDACKNATERAINGDFDKQTVSWTLSATLLSMGGGIGALLFGQLSNRLGSIPLMYANCLISIASTIAAGSSFF